jgi:hypothetical protein
LTSFARFFAIDFSLLGAGAQAVKMVSATFQVHGLPKYVRNPEICSSVGPTKVSTKTI